MLSTTPPDATTSAIVIITLASPGVVRQDEFRYKFDDDRPYLHSIITDTDHRSLVPDWPKTFLKHIEEAKKLVVEIPVYSGGAQFATFDVAGLKLPPFGQTEADEARARTPAASPQ